MSQSASDHYEDLVVKYCKDLGLDPKLLRAILTVESGWETYAVRYEPDFKYIEKLASYASMNHITESTELMLQKCSWGLGQVMGATLRSMGYIGPLNALSDPQKGIFWAATYLLKQVTRYMVQDDAIAAYNAGSARFKDDGKTYVNQVYVDKVNKVLKGG